MAVSSYVDTWALADGELVLPPRLTVLVAYPGADDGATAQGAAGGDIEELAPKGFNITIGRTRASALQLKDASVSERHGVIAWNGVAWTLRDVGSSNGSKRNGARLKPLEEAVLLADNDMLKFGDVVCTVKLHPVTAASFTVEQLLHMQFEVMAQNLLAHQERDILRLRQQWSTDRAALIASMPPAVSAAALLLDGAS